MNENDMKDFESKFMGMFENMAKQLENLDDDEDYGDDMADEECIKEAEKMMK